MKISSLARWYVAPLSTTAPAPVIILDTTNRRSVVEREYLIPNQKSEKRPHFSRLLASQSRLVINNIFIDMWVDIHYREVRQDEVSRYLEPRKRRCYEFMLVRRYVTNFLKICLLVFFLKFLVVIEIQKVAETDYSENLFSL